ncbi:GNAT family N-acetyltransferase [Roseateles violae]|uniref:GNAT family N-acetyltransferase n=1 Tax=Roseateles violae TaxID=3058042 RepID=A0ABT8DVB5_9BURK|nr:GNAT family N-acetyltransferase [Pelomonas sp. PFR6]MDN3922212.1 GNAT family N-acetyltransferase [Pelomonas sp. PFR6]
MSEFSVPAFPAQLETARLLLRAPQAGDLDAVFELQADPIANRFSPSGPLASREAAAALLQGWLAHWQARGFGYWAIARREQPEQLIGFGGVMQRSLGGIAGLHLYFRFLPQHWGQGLASEMAQQALELAFASLHAPSVLAVVLPANTPSRKTLERIGMLLKSSLADVPGQAPSLVYELTAARFAGLPRVPPAPTPFGA